MSHRPIAFHFRGATVEIEGLAPGTTVLQWLREHRRATGTKEGCAEGDCGACMVVIGELDAGRLRLEAVNACIQFLPTLDGKALFTVEDLTTLAGGSLHPVQQALVDAHASQCGFCTPGFVMSLWALYENRVAGVDRDQALDAISGNLCRCTGYRPIVDAALAMHAAPRVTLDRAHVIAALQRLAGLPDLEYTAHGRTFLAPKSLEAFAQARLQHPAARIVAGSTDVGLWVTKQLKDIGDVLYTGGVATLKSIATTGERLEIGAAASLNDAYDALIADHPEWTELKRRFASLPIRNAGTLGGNVANGSPIGDSMPGLIALGASVVLRKGAAERELPMEDFYLAYQKTALEAGEFLRAVRVPRGRNTPVLFRTYKIAKRYEQDISAVCAAFALVLEGGRIAQARVAFGGMAATPKRAPACEAALTGQGWNEATAMRAAAALARDYQPLDDLRASAAYRREVAGQMLIRFWHETGGAREAAVRIEDLAPVAAAGARA
ncbi:MAG: xanthine dehydrogenase small subunit [Betaproteobacteria bacterium]|nr:xanthine dehydrogenase small subunit [Betaproteobacteria bacterium]